MILGFHMYLFSMAFEKYCSCVLPIFKNSLVFLFELISLYTFWILPYHQIYDIKIPILFFCLFVCFVVSFALLKIFSVILLFVSAFVAYPFGSHKNVPKTVRWFTHFHVDFIFSAFTLSSVPCAFCLYFETRSHQGAK